MPINYRIIASGNNQSIINIYNSKKYALIAFSSILEILFLRHYTEKITSIAFAKSFPPSGPINFDFRLFLMKLFLLIGPKNSEMEWHLFLFEW